MRKIVACIFTLTLIISSGLGFAANENKGLHLGGLDKDTKKAKIEEKKATRQADVEARKAEKEAEKAKKQAEKEAKKKEKEAEKAKRKAEREAKRKQKELEGETSEQK